MICPNCSATVPLNVSEPRFCYACGNPVTQLCPYEDPMNGTRIELRSDNNTAPTVCPGCRRMLKVCVGCGRLHRLDETRCRNNRTGCSLGETTEAYPTPYGPLSGTRAVRIAARTLDPTVAVPKLDVGATGVLCAFRHDMLVMASLDRLYTFGWAQDRWTRTGLVSLQLAAGNRIKSLMLDDGLAYLLTDDKIIAVLLVEQQVQFERAVKPLLQTKNGNQWICIVEDSATRSAQIHRIDVFADKVETIPLQISINEVLSLVADGPIVVGTRGQGIWRALPGENSVMSIAENEFDWVRLAMKEGQMVALGKGPQGGMALLHWDIARDQTVGPIPLSGEYEADFAWAGDNLYLMTESRVATYDVRSLTTNPRAVNLPAGEHSIAGLLAVTDRDERTELAIRRTQGNFQALYFCNPENGQLRPIGDTMEGIAQLCIAHDRLLVVAEEGRRAPIYTYVFGGNP